MAKRKNIPEYGTVVMNGIEYYRTRIEDADGKRVALYAKTREELYSKFNYFISSVIFLCNDLYSFCDFDIRII